MSDRTVHAEDRHVEIVRYDRRGHWYIEPTHPSQERQRVSVTSAARRATVCKHYGGRINFGLPGGQRFDALARQIYAEPVIDGGNVEAQDGHILASLPHLDTVAVTEESVTLVLSLDDVERLAAWGGAAAAISEDDPDAEYPFLSDDEVLLETIEDRLSKARGEDTARMMDDQEQLFS